MSQVKVKAIHYNSQMIMNVMAAHLNQSSGWNMVKRKKEEESVVN